MTVNSSYTPIAMSWDTHYLGIPFGSWLYVGKALKSMYCWLVWERYCRMSDRASPSFLQFETFPIEPTPVQLQWGIPGRNQMRSGNIE